MLATTTVYSTLVDPEGRPVARRPITVQLVSASRTVHNGTTLAVHARTVTDSAGGIYEVWMEDCGAPDDHHSGLQR